MGNRDKNDLDWSPVVYEDKSKDNLQQSGRILHSIRDVNLENRYDARMVNVMSLRIAIQ